MSGLAQLPEHTQMPHNVLLRGCRLRRELREHLDHRLGELSGRETDVEDALPNAKLAPTTDPTWDKVKLDVQQNIGLAVQPGGDPKQVLDRLQRTATGAESR